MSRHLKVREVADALHRHPNKIYRWLEEGFIHGKKVRDQWLIPVEEIEKILNEPWGYDNSPKDQKK